MSSPATFGAIGTHRGADPIPALAEAWEGFGPGAADHRTADAAFGYGPMRTTVATMTGAPNGTDPSVTGAVNRLADEFGSAVERDLVRRVVLECRRELDAAPELALPELVERLARQRLLRLGYRPRTDAP